MGTPDKLLHLYTNFIKPKRKKHVFNRSISMLMDGTPAKLVEVSCVVRRARLADRENAKGNPWHQVLLVVLPPKRTLDNDRVTITL